MGASSPSVGRLASRTWHVASRATRSRRCREGAPRMTLQLVGDVPAPIWAAARETGTRGEVTRRRVVLFEGLVLPRSSKLSKAHFRRVRERAGILGVYRAVRVDRHAARHRELSQPRAVPPHREELAAGRVAADGIAARPE